jgi:hypothetical protein
LADGSLPALAPPDAPFSVIACTHFAFMWCARWLWHQAVATTRRGSSAGENISRPRRICRVTRMASMPAAKMAASAAMPPPAHNFISPTPTSAGSPSAEVEGLSDAPSHRSTQQQEWPEPEVQDARTWLEITRATEEWISVRHAIPSVLHRRSARPGTAWSILLWDAASTMQDRSSSILDAQPCTYCVSIESEPEFADEAQSEPSTLRCSSSYRRALLRIYIRVAMVQA